MDSSPLTPPTSSSTTNPSPTPTNRTFPPLLSSSSTCSTSSFLSSSTSASSSNGKQLNKNILRAPQLQLQVQPQLQSEKNPISNNNTPSILTSIDNSNLTDDLNNSRTPDSGVFSQGPHPAVASVTAATNQYNNSNGLKFSYEPQIPQGISDDMNVDCRLLPTDMKYSPPSSPGSEAGSSRKRGRKSLETAKESSVFTNGGIPPHMLGNQINPASGVSQKLSDQLKMEIQDHSIFNATGDPPIIGVPFPGKLHVSNITIIIVFRVMRLNPKQTCYRLGTLYLLA